jgi:chemotaxis protein MotB
MDRRQSERSKKTGAPAWMVTFGDLMALLLTFFVLMLSLSKINEEKYSAISEALGESFGPQQMQLLKKSGVNQGIIEMPAPKPEDKQSLDRVIEDDFHHEMDMGDLSLLVDEGRVSLSFPETLAFASGSDQLTPQFIDILQKMARILAGFPGMIVVSGHTDDIPVHNAKFQSNWSLSSARAVAVVERLISNGIPANRLSAVAYADTQPVVPNSSPELRAKNRRVEISIVVGDKTK